MQSNCALVISATTKNTHTHTNTNMIVDRTSKQKVSKDTFAVSKRQKTAKRIDIDR